MASVSETLGLSGDATAEAASVSPEPVETSTVSGETPTASQDAGNDVTTEDGVTVIEAPAIDMDQMGDHLVPVKISGETEWKPLSEVAAGHQRLEDYTRKTQEVATWKRENEQADQLWQAFQTNPDFTAKALAESRGLRIADSDTPSEPDVYRTPEEQQVAELKGELDQMKQLFAQTQAQTEIDRKFVALESEAGAVDRAAIRSHMHRIGVADPKVAWADMNYDAALNGRANVANDAAKQAVIEAKREAQVVHRPVPNAHKATTGSSVEVPSNLREASLAAENDVKFSEKQLFQSLPWLKGTGN